MRHLFLKTLYITAIVIMATSSAYADSKPYEIFSHLVLDLPIEVKNEIPWSTVITTTDDWNIFYSDLFRDGTEPAELITAPAIDFETYQLIVGGIGVQTNGGYSVVIRKVIELSESLQVDALFIRPGDNCIVPAVMSYPSIAVLVKKTDKPLRFSFSNLVLDCSER